MADGNGKLAVVLSGNGVRAAAALGALAAVEAGGRQPDVLVGVSGGAIAAALTVACGSAQAARDVVYDVIRRKTWQDVADIDYDAVSELRTRPQEVNGLLCGDALQQLLLDGPIGHRGFQHLERPLFVVTTDLNSGREVVFGNLVQADPEGQPFRAFARAEADLERVNVATACRASASVPGLFQPLSLDAYCLVDGSLRARQALAVAAAQDVDQILWLHAGLDADEQFSLVMDYAGQSFAAGISQALTVAMADQFDPHTGDPALEGKTVRYLDLAASSLPTAELTRTQQVYESGRRTVETILSTGPLADGGLFGADAQAAAEALGEVRDEETDSPRFQVIQGQGGRDVLAIHDLRPTLQTEFGYEFDEYLERQGEPRVIAAEPQPTADWGSQQAERHMGLGKLTGLTFGQFLGYGSRATGVGLRTAWQSVGLDKGWAWLSEKAGELALNTSDTLNKRGRGDQADSNGAATPAPAPASPAEETPAAPPPSAAEQVEASPTAEHDDAFGTHQPTAENVAVIEGDEPPADDAEPTSSTKDDLPQAPPG